MLKSAKSCRGQTYAPADLPSITKSEEKEHILLQKYKVTMTQHRAHLQERKQRTLMLNVL